MAKRWLLLALPFSVACPVAWAQEPAGPAFRVNSYTTGYQHHPAVASDASGNFVVVWTSNGQDDGSYAGVFGQRFNSSGTPQGSEFQVNSYTTGVQYHPAVASDPGRNFVVVWASNGQDGSGYGIFGQRFDTSGVPLGSEFRVNSYTPGAQRYPAVASDLLGNFIVVWESWFQDGDRNGVFGQRFSASAIPQGNEFQVNSYTTGHQGQPAMASDPSGDFVVVWTSYGQDGSVQGVIGQRFDAFVGRQGSEFQVNSYTTGFQGYPAVALNATRDFVVVWQSFAQDGSGYGVFGQRFDGAGIPRGSEFQANSYTTNQQRPPEVANDANGNFVVVWTSVLQDGDSNGVFGQRFNASGVPQGAEFRVNSYTTSGQSDPAVALQPNGDFVVAWDGQGAGDNVGIFGQRFGDLIFRDGFE